MLMRKSWSPHADVSRVFFVVGIVGAVIAGYLLPLMGIHLDAGFIRSVINAVIGASSSSRRRRAKSPSAF